MGDPSGMRYAFVLSVRLRTVAYAGAHHYS